MSYVGLIAEAVFRPLHAVHCDLKQNAGGLPVAGALQTYVLPHDHGRGGNFIEWDILP